MPYEIVRSPQARRDIREFARYLRAEADDNVARTYLAASEQDFEAMLAVRPKALTWFHETGAPYRAKVFRAGRTTY